MSEGLKNRLLSSIGFYFGDGELSCCTLTDGFTSSLLSPSVLLSVHPFFLKGLGTAFSYTILSQAHHHLFPTS